MAYKVLFAEQAARDFELIFNFLVDSYIDFGDSPDNALERAETRLQSIQQDIETLTANTFRGTVHDDMLPGIRHITLNRAIIWFEIVETEKQVRILAVFFGGQDHVRQMLIRLLSEAD